MGTVALHYLVVMRYIECTKRKQKLDIIFLLDGSGSVSSNFGDIKSWTQNMAAKFDVESGINQIGVVQFSGRSNQPRK